MRLIDADALYDDATKYMAENEVLYRFSPIQIDRAPTIDAVPVVRCKDCQFWQRHTQVNRDYGKCERFGTVTTNCNDFCSLGAKKNEE